MTFSVTSHQFTDGAAIPTRCTCDGEDRSPDLAWTGVPAGTRSMALTVTDPDAPGGTWVHWVHYNLPADGSGLPAGASDGGMPAHSRAGLNDWQRPGYGGPCPPRGRHRYVFTVYALDTMLPDLATPTLGDLLGAMAGHVLGTAVLTGTYQRAR